MTDGHTERITCVAFSPTKPWLASASYDKTIRLWHWETTKSKPQLKKVLEAHTETVWSIAFSPDGQWLASCGNDKKVLLWDLNDLNADPYLLIEHESFFRSVTFSSDSQTLAAGGHLGIVVLWNLTKIEQSMPSPILCPSLGVGIGALAFRPGNHLGETLILGCWDDTIQILELPNRLEDARGNRIYSTILRGHSKGISSLSFHPNEGNFASGSHDGSVRIWGADTQVLADSVCKRVWRNLSLDEWKNFVGNEISYQKTCGKLPSGKGAPTNAPTAFYK
jgi:WD40 repeat protein